MFDRVTAHHGMRIATAIALVMAMVALPIRPAWLGTRARRPDGLRRVVGVGKTNQAYRPAATSPATRPIQVKALPSQDGEELSCILRSASRPSDHPAVAPPKSQCNLAACGLPQALHPLRC